MNKSAERVMGWVDNSRGERLARCNATGEGRRGGVGQEREEVMESR